MDVLFILYDLINRKCKQILKRYVIEMLKREAVSKEFGLEVY